METVQHHLNELDIRQLLDRYFCDYPIDFEPPALKDLTVSQIRRRYRDAMRRFVVRLRGLDVKDVEDGKISILFAYRCMEDWSYRRSIDFGLVHADEILPNAMAYASAKAKEKTVNDIRARGMRPDEGVLGKTAPATSTVDPHKLTRAERDDLAKRALRGETISF